MRLGDLDALRQHSNTFHTDDGPVEAVPVEEIDAAPTVSHKADSVFGFVFRYFNERDPDAVAAALDAFDRRQP